MMDSIDRADDLRSRLSEWLDDRLQEPERPHARSQLNEIAKELAEKAFAESVRLGEDKPSLRERLDDAYNILESTKWTLTPVKDPYKARDELDENEARERDAVTHTVWRRHDPNQALYMGYDSEHMVCFDQAELHASVAEYLERPWLSKSSLEWIFVDAMIYREVCQFGDAIKEKYIPGKRNIIGMNETYSEAKGDLRKIGSINLRLNLEKLAWKIGAGIVAPVAGIWLLSRYSYSDAAFFCGLGYSLLFLIWMAWRVGRGIYRRATGYKEPYVKALDLWGQMADVYRLTAGPVVNPTMLRDALLKTRDAGAIWDAPLYSLVDRIVARDPSAWVIGERYAYKSGK